MSGDVAEKAGGMGGQWENIAGLCQLSAEAVSL